MNPLAPRTVNQLQIQRTDAVRPLNVNLLNDWLSSKSKKTIEAYRESIALFCRYLEETGRCALESQHEKIQWFVNLSRGEGYEIGSGYKTWLRARGNVSGTVNQRLAAIRSLVQITFEAGCCAWTLTVKNEKTETYKDTSGPGADGFEKMLAVAAAGVNQRKAVRDIALLWMFHGQALRRNGVASLDLEHYEPENHRVAVLLKGSRDDVRTWFTLSEQTESALRSWLEIRGDKPGPLFCSLDHKADALTRISGEGLWWIISDIGERSGLTTWCHALRHSGITEALDRTGGDVRAVQRFSGHKDVRTLMRYDDNRTDLGGEVARKVGAAHKKKKEKA